MFSDKNAVSKCNWIDFKTKEKYFEVEMEYPKNLYCWTIWLKNENIPIGGATVHHQEDEYYHRELGYSVHPNFWNKGYFTKAVSTVLDFLINKASYERVSAECITDNIASKRVMEKVGMTFEGIKRKTYCKNNKLNFMTIIYIR